MNAMRFVGAVLAAGFVGPGAASADEAKGEAAALDEDALKAVQSLEWAACVKVFDARAPKENR